MVLQGHEHCYARKITKGINQIPATPIYLISQFSPKDYRTNLSHSYDRVGHGCRYFQIIDVSSDTLSLKTYTEHDELYDHVQIIKVENKCQITDLVIGKPEHVESHSPRFRQ